MCSSPRRGDVTLLDFGIARLVAVDEAEGSTRPGQLVLTPEYAAPEQARGETASVAMDVYALGVMLHELCAGARPAWQRLVMTRATDAAIEAAMVPPSRATAEPGRQRALRGDLDRVLLKALAPDPSQRYATVAELREDLRRVREGYPILARRASVVERTARLARRNPLLATATVALALVTIAFSVNATVQGRRLAAERDRANVERDRANDERDRARATAAVLEGLFDRADPFAPGRGDTLLVTQVLDEGVARVNRELATQPMVRAELLQVLGRAYIGLGRYADAERTLDTARALLEAAPVVDSAALASTLVDLGNVARRRDRLADAEALHGRALTIRETNAAPTAARAAAPAAGPPPPTGPTVRAMAASLANVGTGHMERGRFDSARIYIDSALGMLRGQPVLDTAHYADALNNRAALASRTGDLASALRIAQESHELNHARLGSDHPRVASELANVGFLLDRLGRSAEAVPLLREALVVLRERLPPAHPATRSAMLNLGGALSRTAQFDEAEAIIREVEAIERGIGEEGKVQLTFTLDNLAGVLEKRGRLDAAEAAYREAYEIRQAKTGDADPNASVLLSKLADIACRRSDTPGALLPDFERALVILDRMLPPGHGFRVGPRGQYGACLLRAGRRDDGERELLAAFELARRGPANAHGAARHAGRELLALYAGDTDGVRRAAVRAALDSLEATPRPR